MRLEPYSQPCGNLCTYCYAKAEVEGSLLKMGRKLPKRVLRIANPKTIADRFIRVLDNNRINEGDYMDWAVSKGWFTEIGTMAEPLIDYDKEYNITWDILNLYSQYELPIYINTKGNLLLDNDYFDLICEFKKHGLVVDLALISLDQEKLKKFEPRAPSISDRLKIIEDLCDQGVNVVISCRPILAGVTDVDFEEYIERLCQLGVKSIHMRTLVISGMMIRRQLWKDYAKAHNMVFKAYSYRYSTQYFKDLSERAREVANKYNVAISQSHTSFFEGDGASNKCDYRKMDGNVRNHLFPYNLVRLLNKPYDNKHKKQMLHLNELSAWNNADPFLEVKVNLSKAPQLIYSTSCCERPTSLFLKMNTIINNMLWNGWQDKPAYIESIDGIVLLLKDGKPMKDNDGNRIYGYLPLHLRPERKSSHLWKNSMDIKEFEAK